MAPPKSFTDLSSAHNAINGTLHNVIGVVVDLMAPRMTRSDWVMTFKLLDPKLRDAVYGSQGLTVRFFKRDWQHLPQVRNVGDVVLIRNIKASPFNNEPLLLSNFQTSAIVFPASSIPDPTFQLAYQGSKRVECLGAPIDREKVTIDEQNYAIALKHDVRDFIAGFSNTDVAGIGEGGFVPSAVSEPPAKRPRLSEPDLVARPPPIERNGFVAQQRQSVGSHQAIAHPDLPARPPPVDRTDSAARKAFEAHPASAQPVQQSNFGPKFKLVKDLAHYHFADVCAQVVKIYPLPYGGCDLYVSDYTSNKNMWYYPPPEEDTNHARDGDQFGYAGGLHKRQFPGPYEWYVLKVNVKDPHAYFVSQKVKEGDFVLLRNVKMKIKSDGAKLEGDMWPDSMNPDKVQVRKLLNHDLVEVYDVLQRKDRYWESRKRKVAKQEEANMTETARRKERKKKKTEAEKRSAQLQEQAKPPELNPNIRCSSDEVPVTPIRDILDPDNERHTNDPPGGESYIIPFINARYRARVRVVDFEPKALEDFAVPADLEADEEERSSNSISGVSWQTSQKWVWSFRLLVEDASAASHRDRDVEGGGGRDRVWLTFHHDSAQHLLGNGVEDPCDLRSDKALLGKLREKMYLLWGNLEEKSVVREAQKRMGKEIGGLQGVSNRPFECCVVEYGVPVEEDAMEIEGEQAGVYGVGLGWRRMYAGCGVTIL